MSFILHVARHIVQVDKERINRDSISYVVLPGLTCGL